jgi:biopolymer transport protein TolR
MGEINIIPLVDVVLVLLMVFMMTAPMLTPGVTVDLPQTGAEALPKQQDEPLVVTVRPDGRVFLGDNEVADPWTLPRKVKAVRREAPNRPVLLRGDKEVPYGAVAATLTLLQKGGVANVGLVTEPVEGP